MLLVPVVPLLGGWWAGAPVPFPEDLSRAVAAVCICGLLIPVAWRALCGELALPPMAGPLFLLAAAGALAALRAERMRPAMEGAVALAGILLLVGHLSRGKWNLGRPALLGALVVASVGVWQVVATWRTEGVFHPLVGPVGNAGYAAEILVPVLFLVVGRIAKDKIQPVWAGHLAVCVLLAASLWTGTIAAWLAVGLGVLWFNRHDRVRGPVARRTPKALYSAAAAVGLLVPLVLAPAPPAPGAAPADAARLQAAPAPWLPHSARVRLGLWAAGLEAAGDRVVLGWGLDNAESALALHRRSWEADLSRGGTPERPRESRATTAHNEPLQILLTTGALGLLACLWALRRAWPSLLSAQPGEIAALFGLVVFACVRSPLSDNAFAACLFWCLVARLHPGRLVTGARARAAGLAVVVLLAVALPRTVRALGAQLDLASGRPELARRAVERDPWNFNILQWRAMTEEPGTAARRAAFEALRDKHPHHFGAHMTLGAMAASSGELAEAALHFDRAGRYDPHHPGLLRNRERLERDRALLQQGAPEPR